MSDQYRAGDRVEWRDPESNLLYWGTIMVVQGIGANSKYTMKTDGNQQEVQVAHSSVQRKVG